MQFRFDHHDHRSQEDEPDAEGAAYRSLAEAEKASLASLCHETLEAADTHAAACITIRDEDGKALSVATVHATVKRL